MIIKARGETVKGFVIVSIRLKDGLIIPEYTLEDYEGDCTINQSIKFHGDVLIAVSIEIEESGKASLFFSTGINDFNLEFKDEEWGVRSVTQTRRT